MREILFRGKHIHALPQNEHLDGTWVYGYLCDKNYINSPELEGEFLIDPETVCQYTGLTDKNGRKIFEGDIISFDYELSNWGRIARVLFEDGEYRYRAITNAADLYDCRICGENDRCEIIGNIFDNPELIGE